MVMRSDASILHVDFENFTDTLITARNAGIVIDYETQAQILDNFGFEGRRCVHIAASGPGQESRVRLLPAWDAPIAKDRVVLEFVYRPVLHRPVRLKDWPLVRCFTKGEGHRSFELKYLNDPAFGTNVTPVGIGQDEALQVAIELRAEGLASDGTYNIDVLGHGGRLRRVVEDLPQDAWTRFILYRHDGVVELYAGSPEDEKFIGIYQDILPDGEVYMILLGNAGVPAARGSGYWDSVRLGRPLKGHHKVATPEDHIRDVGAIVPVPPQRLRLGREKHLFIDDWSITEFHNIHRIFHRPQKYTDNPLIVPDLPWEGKAIFLSGGVERQHNGDYRMWYYASHPTSTNHKRSRTCLAVSDDGIHWTKPLLGIHEYRGTKDNNIVIMEKGVGSIIIDPDDPRCEFRYKASLRYHGTEGWTSPDGLHWVRHGVIIPQSLDATSVHFDSVRKKYIASIKLGFKGRRYRGYAESADFLNWTDSYLMMDVDEMDAFGDQIYAMQIFRYESLYLGLCKIYHVETTDTCDIHLAVSHNGTYWQRPYRLLTMPRFASKERNLLDYSDSHNQPFIPTGPPGSWDFGNNDCPSTPPIRKGDELRFYYSGRPCTHSGKIPQGHEWSGPGGAIGLTVLRLDGFVSSDADTSGGYIITKPLVLEGKNLFVNVDAGCGELKVEVLNVHFRPIPPFTAASAQTIRSNSVRTKCRWKQTPDLSTLAGKSVRLKFYLTGASLYAFWCE